MRIQPRTVEQETPRPRTLVRRHQVRYLRFRPDMSVYDVPLLLGEEEGYFGDLG
jgi:hypothetical protein